MKEEIHPEIFEAPVSCVGCGSVFTTLTTVKEIKINVCNACHPFYTGKQKLVDTEGRVDRFKRKYQKNTVTPPAQ